jgi:hypothetical protein
LLENVIASFAMDNQTSQNHPSRQSVATPFQHPESTLSQAHAKFVIASFAMDNQTSQNQMSRQSVAPPPPTSRKHSISSAR